MSDRYASVEFQRVHEVLACNDAIAHACATGFFAGSTIRGKSRHDAEGGANSCIDSAACICANSGLIRVRKNREGTRSREQGISISAIISVKMTLELRRPSSQLVASFAEMRNAFLAVGDDRWSPPNNLETTRIAHTDVLGYITLLNDWANAKNLPEGWVPSDEFWIVKDNKVVGSVGIRHYLNDWLRQVGGHIGYDVHPAYRNQGIATFALGEALKILWLLGEREALITCSDDNLASARVIEKCGGVRIADSKTTGGNAKRRYVIALTGVKMVAPQVKGF